jgi:hypothetical protein
MEMKMPEVQNHPQVNIAVLAFIVLQLGVSALKSYGITIDPATESYVTALGVWAAGSLKK